MAAPEGAAAAFTPDDIFAGAEFPGPVLIYDFDPYYMGGCLAELLRQRGQTVHLATPDTLVSPWAGFTNEQPQIHARLLHLGIGLERERVLSAFDGTRAALACVHNGRDKEIACRSLVVVGARTPRDYGEALDRATRPERAERREHAFRDLAAPATELGAP
jgi:dimethylamine/trimethylamine dehydrogenase